MTKKETLAKLKDEIKFSLEQIPGLAEYNDYYEDLTADEIVDKVMEEENQLDFEVGYLKGMEYALDLINNLTD